MSEDRTVRTTLIIDEHGAVKAVHAVGEESGHTETKLGKFDKSIKGLGHSFGGLKGLIAGGLGLGSLVYGLKDVLSTTSEIAEETHKFHTITGIGEQSSLYYTAALKARGIGAQAGGNAFKFLAKNVQLAERQEQTYGIAQSKAAAKHKMATGLLGVQATAFKRLGIDLVQFGHLSEQGKFDAVIHKFESMKDGAEKTRLELQIFGRGGTALSPVLDKGALSLSHADDMAKRFFPTLKGGAHELEELQERQTESKMAWEGLEFVLGTKLIPVYTEASAWFSKTVSEAEKGKGVWGELENTFEGIAHFAGGAFGFIKGIASEFGIHLGSGSIGAALVALAAGHKAIKHPVSSGKTLANITKKVAPYLVGPQAVPTGMALGLGYGGYLTGKTLYGGSLLGGFTPGNPYGVTPHRAPHWSTAERHEKALGIASLNREAREFALVERLSAHPKLITPTAAKMLTRNEVQEIAKAFADAHQAITRWIGGRPSLRPSNTPDKERSADG